MLARAITLIESENPHDAPLARESDRRLSRTTVGGASRRHHRDPGVGKSTHRALGMQLIDIASGTRRGAERRSQQPDFGGSILGDKTRMNVSEPMSAPSSVHPRARTLRRSRAAYARSDSALRSFRIRTILVETVGGRAVGNRGTRDDRLLSAADARGRRRRVAGIKRGILEMVDLLAINKADGDNKDRAGRARNDYATACICFRRPDDGWIPPLLPVRD